MNSRVAYVWKEGMIVRTPQIILYVFKFVNRNEVDTNGKTPLSKSGRRKET